MLCFSRIALCDFVTGHRVQRIMADAVPPVLSCGGVTMQLCENQSACGSLKNRSGTSALSYKMAEDSSLKVGLQVGRSHLRVTFKNETGAAFHSSILTKYAG